MRKSITTTDDNCKQTAKKTIRIKKKSSKKKIVKWTKVEHSNFFSQLFRASY